jgi:hypothetical protein
MPTLIVSTDRHTVVDVGWTNNWNAWVDNTAAATALNGSTTKNITNSGDFGFPAVSTAQIPDGSTIDAVRMVVRGYLSASNITGGTLGIEPRLSPLEAGGSEATTSNATTATDLVATFSTLPSLANLRTAGHVRARARGTKGNSASGLTVYAEYIWMEIDYTVTEEPVDHPRTAADTSAIGSDTALRTLGQGRTSADTVSSTDTVGRLAALAKTATDTTTQSESVSGTVEQPGGQDFPRTAADSLTTADSLISEKRGEPQLLFPVSDIDTDSWTGEDGRTTNLYPSISDASDATYIRSPQAPGPSDAATFAFESGIDPDTSLAHIIRYRYAAYGTATLVVELLEGTTLIASWEHENPPQTPTPAAQVLSTAEAAAITDYASLRVRFRGG